MVGVLRGLGWRWALPALVTALVLGVLALHLLSHGRSLVSTDPATAGHHAVALPSAVLATTDAHELVGLDVDAAGCGNACEPPSMIMTCLLALVLLVGRLLLRAPSEARWLALVVARGVAARAAGVGRGRLAEASAVCRISLGISRT